MKKLKPIFLALIIFALGIFGGCAPDNSDFDGLEFAEITGVKEISIKVGEGTDQKLLDGVNAVLIDGTIVKPTLVKGDYNLNQAGKYTISYEYGNAKKTTNVYVYAMPKIYFNGQEILSDRLQISFGQANASYDFTKGITIADSFGKPLTVEKSNDSNEFNKQEGEYTVCYSATDAVGNTLVKTVTFVVSASSAPVATSGSYSFDFNGCVVPCDLKGETSGLLYEDDELVDPSEYYFANDKLVLSLDYCLENLGRHEYTVETNEGFATLTVDIVDEGNPIFHINSLKDTVLAQGYERADLPTDLRYNSNGNDYSYTLFNVDNDDFKVVETEKSLRFYTSDGKALPLGEYTLSVTATAENGMTSTMEYDFTVDSLNGAILKTSKVGVIETYDDNGSVVTAVNYNGAEVHSTPFSDTVWSAYITAQEDGGKSLCFDVKFIGSATLNGFIIYGENNESNYYWSNTIRENTNFINFCDADGEIVEYRNLEVDTWYKMIIYIDAIKTEFADMDSREFVGYTGSSLRFGPNIEGEVIHLKNAKIVDNVVAFKTGGGGTVSSYYDSDAVVTVGTSSHQWNGRLFFSNSVWADYISAQTAGGKVMSMDINFGDSVNLSGYLSGSSADLNNFRANPTFFRFYGSNGKMVAYDNLQANTWYRLDLDIDAIKTGIGEQSFTNEGKETSICFARQESAPGTLSVKNLRFVDAYETGLIFKSAKKDVITFSYDGDTLVTEVHYCNDTTATPFADSVFKDYLTAQTAGGMVLRYQIKFSGSATINGYINSTTLAGYDNPRGNRAYFRYYDAQGNEIAYANLSTDTWYTMEIDIDAIKGLGTVQENALNGNITGCSLRFGPNIEGETIFVKNVEFINKQ